MFRFMLALASFIVCSVSDAAEFERLAKSIIAMKTATHTTVVTPSPSGPVSDICPDCNGKGWSGDGTIRLPCNTCKGTGKIKHGEIYPPSTIYEAPEEERQPYPTGRRITWSHPNGLKQHLMGPNHHIDPADLEGMSNAEMEALHSDHHDEMQGRGRVDWSKLPNTTAAATTNQKRTQTYQSSGCPGGICPSGGTSSGPLRRLFGR